MRGATNKRLGVRVETMRVLSGAALDRVIGGAGDPQVPKTALPAQAQFGDGISKVLTPTNQCILTCFCTHPNGAE
jgi:hypothetical protein